MVSFCALRRPHHLLMPVDSDQIDMMARIAQMNLANHGMVSQRWANDMFITTSSLTWTVRGRCCERSTGERERERLLHPHLHLAPAGLGRVLAHPRQALADRVCEEIVGTLDHPERAHVGPGVGVGGGRD